MNELIEDVVAIDGKQLRGSDDAKLGKRAIYMVSAWSTTNHLVLGQRQVDEKSNEIRAIPELLAVVLATQEIIKLDFSSMEKEARERMESAISSGTWKNDCKGRDLLKAFCAQHGMKYEHFRNSLIARIGNPPPELDEILQSILEAN